MFGSKKLFSPKDGRVVGHGHEIIKLHVNVGQKAHCNNRDIALQ